MAGVLRAAGVTRGDRVALVVSRRAGSAPDPAGRRHARGGGRAAEPGVHARRVRLLHGGPGPAARAPLRRRGHGGPGGEQRRGRRRRAPRRGRRARAACRWTAGSCARRRTSSPREPDDVALLLHTSGTTSRPKQVPLSHRNLMASARAIAAHYRLGSEDGSFVAMPLFHVHGLVASVFGALLGGGRRDRPASLLAAAHARPARARRGHLVLRGSDAPSDGPRARRAARPHGGARVAVPAVLQLGALTRAHGSGRGHLRGAAARGLRHDRGEPSDRLESAAAAGAAGLHGRRRRRRGDPHRRQGGRRAAAGRRR